MLTWLAVTFVGGAMFGATAACFILACFMINPREDDDEAFFQSHNPEHRNA